MFSTNLQSMELLADEQQRDRARTFRHTTLLRHVGMEDKRGGALMMVHRTIRQVVTALILTALIALALWLPFRQGSQTAATVWLPFRQGSQTVATVWLPFRS